MGYLFLTGATGLLGSYLIRDLIRAGTRLAVLVRATKFASARHRVEHLVAHWEQQAGYSLPRPVVLEGDISKPDLGLDVRALAWASQNVEAVMHNAASLTFHADGPDSEPWRSNLHGTRHVLDFCRRAGLRKFHHVSTAYVCGLRDDIVRESELDVGQTHGNDYEVSKFEAEKMVRAADFLDSPTVYRPGIILGDSQTGYTTTFHGFYVPLKLVSTTIAKTAGLQIPREMIETGVRRAGERLREVLELTGSERKNFVPVDWCSAVMTAVYTNPHLHGTTYHLTPRERVSARLVQDVMEEAVLEQIEKQADATAAAGETGVDWDQFERFFIEGMDVYRAYWRDDPTFDSSNVERAMPHLPCPDLDAEVMRRMCRFAIASNFGWPRPPLIKPDFDLEERLAGLTNHGAGRVRAGTNGATGGPQPIFLGLRVNGRGGGEWELRVEQGRVVAAEPGIGPRSTATYYLNTRTFERLAGREVSAEQAIGTGGVLIEGNGVPLNELTRLLADVTVGECG